MKRTQGLDSAQVSGVGLSFFFELIYVVIEISPEIADLRLSFPDVSELMTHRLVSKISHGLSRVECRTPAENPDRRWR